MRERTILVFVLLGIDIGVWTYTLNNALNWFSK